MSLKIIVCVGLNNEIGKDNNLIWRLKPDMEFFKKKTTGHKIVMGRKTFESLPGMLPNREHIVITSKDIQNVECFKSVDDFLAKYINSEEDIYVIGGGSIYEQLINFCDELFITLVTKRCEDADTFFPDFNCSEYRCELIEWGNYNDTEYIISSFKKG